MKIMSFSNNKDEGMENNLKYIFYEQKSRGVMRSRTPGGVANEIWHKAHGSSSDINVAWQARVAP